MNEKLIKCKLIDYLLKKYPNSIVGAEVPFLAGRRWVDVLLINRKRELIAFEVKSEFDTLRRLESQLKDYLRTFDRVYIIFSTKHKNHNVISRLPKNVGYAFIDNNEKLSFVKAAIKNKKLFKLNLSYFLWKKDMLIFRRNQSESAIKLRARLMKQKSVSDIHEMAIKALLERYLERFNIFINEKSQHTHQEDLEYLTKIYKIDL